MLVIDRKIKLGLRNHEVRSARSRHLPFTNKVVEVNQQKRIDADINFCLAMTYAYVELVVVKIHISKATIALCFVKKTRQNVQDTVPKVRSETDLAVSGTV